MTKAADISFEKINGRLWINGGTSNMDTTVISILKDAR